MDTDILIIGGGLSGLALADHLHRMGRDFQLLEARSRFGGRIKTAPHEGAAFDLGPSWFWPGQPRMAAMADRFALQVFDQHAAGEVLYEDEAGAVFRGMGFTSMEGSWRIAGGIGAMTAALAASLPPERLHLNTPVTKLAPGIANGTIRARHIVLAMPPRVAASIDGIGADLARALNAVPTWMGGQAKFVAVYKRPFWRDAGLSGDAASRRGPLAEIHDASGASGTPAALFGFVGTPASARKDQADALKAAAVAQLGRIFGAEALAPIQAHLADWAFAPETSSALDHAPLTGHPTYGLPSSLTGLWGGSLHIGSTETAQEFGGYLEGALERAEDLAATLAP